MTPQQKQYFDNMLPGQSIQTSDTKNPDAFISAAKEYINQGGKITFTDDYSLLRKDYPIPTDGKIHVWIDGVQIF